MDTPPEPLNLRFLRRLVTLLTLVMIAGMVVVIALLVTRLQAPPASLSLPPHITMPDGMVPLAYTRGPEWFAVTSDESILIFDLDGTLRQTIEIR